MQIGTTNIFILKCKSSGWTWGRITKDKTSETTCKIFHKYITSYNRLCLVISDRSPAFSNMFLEFLHSHHISHIYSSAYHAQSNSPAERGVRSIKDVLNKIPSFTDKTVRTVIFNVNQHVAPDGSGSPAERFFKRRIRTGLPTIIQKEVKYEDLMNIRALKQIRAAKKKGRSSADVFEIDDEVRI